MQRTNIFLTEEQQKRLSSRAREEGVSKSSVVRRILDEALAISTAEVSVQDAINASSGLWADRGQRDISEVLRWRREMPLDRLAQ